MHQFIPDHAISRHDHTLDSAASESRVGIPRGLHANAMRD